MNYHQLLYKNMYSCLNHAIQMNILDIPVACLITEHSTDIIIATAGNTKEQEYIATGHAEINAINNACKKLNNWRLDNYDIYITLEPCLMCIGAIIEARFQHVIFGAYNSTTSHLHLLDQARIQYTGGILESQCSSQLKEYFNTKLRDI